MLHSVSSAWCRSLIVAAACFTVVSLSTPAQAQDAISKEGAAAVKAAFVADLEVMRGKFVGLAEAFPPDKYSYRPMEGVRSVAEVLALAASEGYSFVPTNFGGKAGATREEMAALRTSTDKAALIAALNKAFAHAKSELESIDPATLTGKRTVMGQQRSVVETALMIGGDLHEHLGQLIAYARANRVVPPWSK
jgi:hypothetical protein